MSYVRTECVYFCTISVHTTMCVRVYVDVYMYVNVYVCVPKCLCMYMCLCVCEIYVCNVSVCLHGLLDYLPKLGTP